MDDRKKRKRAYIGASKRICEGDGYACFALYKEALHRRLFSVKREFEEIFRPYYSQPDEPWWSRKATEKSQLARSLALLLMAELNDKELPDEYTKDVR